MTDATKKKVLKMMDRNGSQVWISWLAVVTIAAGGGWAVFGQGVASAVQQSTYVDPSALPGIYQRYGRAAGDRLWKAGLERIVLRGNSTAASRDTPWSAVVELPGRARVQYGTPPRTATFDLMKASAAGSLTDEDEAMLETLAYDTSDSFLGAIASGHLPRVLGYGFTAPGTDGFGTTVDIHEVVQKVVSRRQPILVAKRFEFDTQTGLLRRVHYQTVRGGNPVAVDVEYSDYASVNGQKAAQRVVRREGSDVVLDLHITSIAIVAKQDDNTFGEQ